MIEPYYQDEGVDLYQTDARSIPCGDASIQTCVTSPPYFGLRNYGVDGQIGLEPTPAAYIAELVKVFREVWRVLKDDGTIWVNIGDSYANDGKWGGSSGGKHVSELHGESGIGRGKKNTGLKPKDLIGIPWLLAFALRDDGWYLRSEIIWAKPNGMPGSQIDRCTSSHETIFLLSKQSTYFSDFDAIKTPPRESTLVRLAQNVQAQAGSHRANGGAKKNGAMKAVAATDKQRGHGRKHAGFNARWDAMGKDEHQSMPAMMRDVWFVPPAGYEDAHFAVMPEEIARRCILAGSRSGDIVLDPFNGSGTTGAVAREWGRRYVGLDLNAEYLEMSKARFRQRQLFPAEGATKR